MSESAVESGLLARVRDALGGLEARSEGDAPGTAGKTAQLLRCTREALHGLREDPGSETFRSLLHRVLEAAGRRNVRLAFHGGPLAEDWTDLVLQAVLASDWTTGRLFFSRARTLGDRTLFLLPRGRTRSRISWSETESQVTACGRALLGMQAAHPESGPVALLGQNSPELALLDLACLVTGTPNVPIPVNSPPDQIEFILRDSRAGALFLGSDELAAASEAAISSGRLRAVHWLDPAREGRGAVLPFSDFLTLGKDVPAESVRRAARSVKCADVATVMYTSGTTGTPNGVPFTHGNLVTKRFARAAAWPEIGEGDVFLCYLPLYHTFGRWLEMLGCVFWGSVYAFAEDASLEPLLHSFQRVRPTTFISVPKKWLQIAESVGPLREEAPADPREEARLSQELVRVTGGRLRRGLSAAGYLPPSAFRRFHAAGIELHSGFGMTEATGGITMTPPGAYRDDSIGVALPGIELDVAPDGELLIRGPYVTPPAAGEPPRTEGWFATGDIVRTDAEGHFRIVDRKKEIFKNLQGETISPRRIEKLLADFDVVERALVVGDRREFCTALLVPAPELRAAYGAPGQGETIDSHELRELFAPAVETVNRFLAPYERILDFAILSADLDPQTELTAKGTPRRQVVAGRMAPVIETMYARGQVEVRVGDVECRVPQWFLRYTGIPSRDVRAVDGFLVARGRKLAIARENGVVRVGDCTYDPGGEELLLGEIFGRAKLWVGNHAVRKFAGAGIEHWWRRGRRFRVRTRLVARPPREGAPDPPAEAREGSDVAYVHECARSLAHPDIAARRGAVDRLETALEGDDRDLESIARGVLLGALADADIRVRALEALVPFLSPERLDEAVAGGILSDPDFLSSEEAQHLGRVALRGDQMDRLAGRARAWERSGSSPVEPLDRLLGYLVCVAVEHRASHLRVRSLLAELDERAPTEERRARIVQHVEELVSGFRSRLPHAAPSKGVSWDDVVEFRGVGVEHARRIRSALAETALLPEAIALFSPAPTRELPALGPASVRVTFLGTGTGRAVHLLEWSPGGLDRSPPRLECILKLALDADWSAVQQEIRLLVRTRTGGSGRPLVKTQGGGFPEHGVWTEEFVPGRTLEELMAELAAEEPAPGRLGELWPFLVSSCAALVVDFWRRTGRRISLAHPTPAKVVLPGHDWLVGGRLVSIADRVETERLVDVLASIHSGIVRPLAERYRAARLDAGWAMLCSAALEVLGEEDGCRRLESEAGTLDPDGRTARAIRRFVSQVQRRGFLPDRVRLAARRYRRWAQLNADATVEAQAQTLDQIEDAYGLGDLDRVRPASRLQLFRHTVFRASPRALTHGLDELIARTLATTPPRAELHRSVTRIRETVTSSDRDEFFLARMLYPHVDPRGRAVLVRQEDVAGGFDTAVAVEHRDSAGEVFRIRHPGSPNEIAALARVFRGAGIRRAPSVGRDDLLIVTDGEDRTFGGLIARRMSDTYARLEWIALGRHRRGRGIGAVLVRDFLERMRAQGIRVVSTGFFRPAFFSSFGFGVDPRYAGLVKFLEPDAHEVEPKPDATDRVGEAGEER